MKRWTELVDIVFVLTCDPKTSIEREFADQLTTKRGTIMEEETLKQFLACTEKTLEQHRGQFKKVVRLDTTNTKTRDGVAKLTDEALTSLHEFLDESICVIGTGDVKISLPDSGLVSDRSVISGFTEIIKSKKHFSPRSKAEQNANLLQPIPCAVLRYEDKLLVLKRKKPGHPLHDTYAVWAGGHVSEADNGEDILLNALNRELTEEVFIKEAFELKPDPIALIRTNEDARASRHIGVLYELVLKSENVALALNQKEFRSTRGSSMSGRLLKVEELGTIYEEMGDWSKFIVDHFWPEKIQPGKSQPQLFSSTNT
jgi:predicted NUDIX family phosphoesterase